MVYYKKIILLLIFFHRYYRSFVFSCHKCSPCCQDTQEDDVEPQCLRQGLSRDRACRYTGRNCQALEPTLLNMVNMVFKTTATQKVETHKIPSSYIIGGIVLMFVLLVLVLVTIFLMYRVYCGAKRNDKPRVTLQLQGEWTD